MGQEKEKEDNMIENQKSIFYTLSIIWAYIILL